MQRELPEPVESPDHQLPPFESRVASGSEPVCEDCRIVHAHDRLTRPLLADGDPRPSEKGRRPGIPQADDHLYQYADIDPTSSSVASVRISVEGYVAKLLLPTSHMNPCTAATGDIWPRMPARRG